MTAVSPTVIDAALRDPQLLGAALGDPSTWSTWFSVLRASFGLSLTAEEQQLFAHVSGNRKLPSKRVRELWCIVGRKGEKRASLLRLRSISRSSSSTGSQKERSAWSCCSRHR